MNEIEVIGRSFLGDVDPVLVSRIRRRAAVKRYRSGDMIVSPADERWTGIVLTGMARVFLTTPSGRQVTMRHALPSHSIGIGAILGDGEVSAQAVVGSSVLRLDADQLSRLAAADSTLAIAIARELSVRLIETFREIVTREQGTVRQRLARQLLHFAGETDSRGEPLVLQMSHEHVAEAVGSAREVVSRHLARFQAERMLELSRGRITLIDPVRLERAAPQAA
jgi:CRP-like cAMP-binding protein